MAVHRVHSAAAARAGCGIGHYSPGVALQEDLPFRARLRADALSVGRNAADVPRAVPQFPLAGRLDLLGEKTIVPRILVAAEALCGFHELAQRPVVKEGNHGALTASQV